MAFVVPHATPELTLCVCIKQMDKETSHMNTTLYIKLVQTEKCCMMQELEAARAAAARPRASEIRKTVSMDTSEQYVRMHPADRGHIPQEQPPAPGRSRRTASARYTAAPEEDAADFTADPDAPEQPSPEAQRQFADEMAHELAGTERPGVRSQFPHPLTAFQLTRTQLEVKALT